MSRLNPALEYLLWYEAHHLRWIATPIMREGDLIIEAGYADAVALWLDGR